MAPRMCQLGGRFSRCRNEALQTCQYCGRSFCHTHSYYQKDHEAVCSRKKCRIKIEDMLAHTEYELGVIQRLDIRPNCYIMPRTSSSHVRFYLIYFRWCPNNRPRRPRL